MSRPRNTPFARWLDGYTVSRVEQEMVRARRPVSRGAIYQWLYGETMPRLEHAEVLIRLSGLTVTDLVSHHEMLTQGEELAPSVGVVTERSKQA